MANLYMRYKTQGGESELVRAEGENEAIALTKLIALLSNVKSQIYVEEWNISNYPIKRPIEYTLTE